MGVSFQKPSRPGGTSLHGTASVCLKFIIGLACEMNFSLIMGQRVSLRPFLRFRASRSGLFYDLSTGDSCPLRIPLGKLGAAVSPADKS